MLWTSTLVSNLWWGEDINGELLVQETHSQVVWELPPGATVLARTKLDAHHVVQYRDNVFGVQYHPEYTTNFMEKLKIAATLDDNDEAHGDDNKPPFAEIQPSSPASIAVVARFLRQVLNDADATPRVLGVEFGPPREGLPHWSELIRNVANEMHPVIVTQQDDDGCINQELWSRVRWEYVKQWDGSEALPSLKTTLRRYAAVVFSGSKFNTTEDIPWLPAALQWVRDAVADNRVPIFGICFGHQLISKALGGVAGFNPKGPELGTHKVRVQPLAGDALCAKLQQCGLLPSPAENQTSSSATEVVEWLVPELHWQVVLECPQGSVSLAQSEMDVNQWLKHSNLVYSTQFHPEYPKEYLVQLGDVLPGIRDAGDAREAYFAGLQDATVASRALIAAFLDLAIRKRLVA